MTNEKYKLLTDDTVDFFGRTLYRIEALKDFSNVLKGEKGGYIENENNLESFGDAWVSGDAWVYGNAKVFDDAEVYGNAMVYDDTKVFENAQVSGNARVYENAQVSGNARVFGDARLSGNSLVCGDAHTDNIKALITISPIGSENGTLTAYKNNKGGISVNRGCFSGTLEEFEKAVEETHGNGKHAKTYKLAIALIKSRLEE